MRLARDRRQRAICQGEARVSACEASTAPRARPVAVTTRPPRPARWRHRAHRPAQYLPAHRIRIGLLLAGIISNHACARLVAGVASLLSLDLWALLETGRPATGGTVRLDDSRKCSWKRQKLDLRSRHADLARTQQDKVATSSRVLLLGCPIE